MFFFFVFCCVSKVFLSPILSEEQEKHPPGWPECRSENGGSPPTVVPVTHAFKTGRSKSLGTPVAFWADTQTLSLTSRGSRAESFMLDMSHSLRKDKLAWMSNVGV